MAYSICKIKNISLAVKVLNGKEFIVDEIYIIPDNERIQWAMSEAVGRSIFDREFEIRDVDGLTGTVMEQISRLQNY